MLVLAFRLLWMVERARAKGMLEVVGMQGLVPILMPYFPRLLPFRDCDWDWEGGGAVWSLSWTCAWIWTYIPEEGEGIVGQRGTGL
jgi:hypothetical protein